MGVWMPGVNPGDQPFVPSQSPILVPLRVALFRAAGESRATDHSCSSGSGWVIVPSGATPATTTT